MLVHFKHITDRAISPTKAHKNDACFDLYASEETYLRGWGVVPTDIRVRIPSGHFGMILSRSGLAAKYGTFVLNAPGIIDSGYTGELQVILATLRDGYLVERGARIAQFMILPVHQMSLLRGDGMVWEGSERGINGLGSSGN